MNYFVHNYINNNGWASQKMMEKTFMNTICPELIDKAEI